MSLFIYANMLSNERDREGEANEAVNVCVHV